MEELVGRILKVYADADTELCRWKDHYEELAKYFLPMKDNVYGADVKGERKHNFLFDSTSVHTLEIFAAMLHTLLSSPSQDFFDFTSGNPTLDQEDDVREWRQNVVKILHNVLSGTNYHPQAHEAFLDIGCFGTLIMRQTKHKDDVVRYHAEPCYNFAFTENADGVVDCIFRKFNYTNSQILEEFGEDIFTPQEVYDMKMKPLEKQELIHAVLPRSRFDLGKKNKRNKKYGSYYIMLRNKKLLKEGGFSIFPYIVTRYQVIAGEVRGRSNAMKALPDARVLNALQKTSLKVAQKIADPVYLLPDDGVMRPFRTAPGSINYYRANMKDAIGTLTNDANPAFIEDISENIRERIRKAFHVDQMLLREGPQMTATEVLQRAEEQLRMLGPAQGRFENEFLRPLVESLYSFAEDAGLIPEAPRGLSLRVKFKSTIARSQNMIEADNLNRMVGTLAPFIQLYPEITDLLDPEFIVRYVSDLHATPQGMIRRKEEVNEIRKESAEYAQQLTDAELQKQNADVMKTQADAVSKLT